jgi:hypothetical protein
MGQPDPTGPRSPASVRRAKGSRSSTNETALGGSIPPINTAWSSDRTGEDEGVDSFNDFLAIIARCLPNNEDAFARAAYLWAGLHGRVALGDAIPTFPWPTEEYIERMLEIHITAQAGRKLR